jgi:MoaA/NifB/PqqE/SkfB family radical SAM enzyme
MTSRLEGGKGLSRMYRRARYAPFLSQLVVTSECNLACAYCSEHGPDPEPVSLEELKRRVDDIARLRSLALEFTGGEPLLHPSLVPLVKYSATKRFRVLGLVTNGRLLTESLVHDLNDAGLTEMQVSVDGMKPGPASPKALESIRDKLDFLAGVARFKVSLTAVVGSGIAEDEVEGVVRFSRDHGFRPRLLFVHGADGSLARGESELRHYRRIQASIGRRLRDPSGYREALLSRGTAPFRCRAGSRYLYVDVEGMAGWCAHTRGLFRKPLHDYSFRDLREQYRTPKPCNPRCTVGCARSCSFLDSWFPQRGVAGKPGADR